MPIQLLVVEDHLALLDVTVDVLAAQGYEVIGISSAEAIDELPAYFVADIAILDLNLPGEDGLSLARRLRQIQPRIGIIMVTARHTLAHKLAGYEHGADIYLTKPTQPEELCATVQALAQRLHHSGTLQPSAFALDTAAELLKTPLGDLALRTSEAVLLHALVLAPQRTLEIWQALEKLNKPIDEQGKAQLEVLVSRLRGKLLAHGAPANPIRPLRGRGYRLCMPLQVD
ncbi:response regulator transcription factor [Simplicispira psychrophila]|uniref:response regulator transcription factor n=1 Tax=Simplicispira psychrophila TaxID=80882 RepID=UPI0005669B44|nr:response regulator transcription factor [Simplicispira psychrophila]